MSHAEVLPERIRELRKERSLTLRQVAATTGLSESKLSQMETGKRRILATEAKSIADALGVPVDDFFRPGESPAE